MSTHKTHREPVINQFGLFPVTVTAVQQLTEHYTRFSLVGQSLHHAVEEISDGTGDVKDAYIKLMVPPPGATAPVDFELNDTWRRDYMSREPHERGWMRTYTVRNSRLVDQAGIAEAPTPFRPAEHADLSVMHRELPDGKIPEIDIDFVLHADAAGQMGPGAAWAANAKVGDTISFLAPMRGNNLWSSWEPGDAENILICVDETAVPAALSIVRSLPAEARAQVLLEVPSANDVFTEDQADLAEVLRSLPNVSLTWLPRGCNGSSSVRGEELYQQLRTILDVKLPEHLGRTDTVTDDEIVWGLANHEHHQTYVFIAGESAVIKTLRRICVNDAGMDKNTVSFMGYWKRGKAES